MAISINGKFEQIGLIDGRGSFFIRVNNNNQPASSTGFSAPTSSRTSANISNCMIDFDLGTYNIESIVVHELTTTEFAAVGKYSSIIVIPLQQ